MHLESILLRLITAFLAGYAVHFLGAEGLGVMGAKTLLLFVVLFLICFKRLLLHLGSKKTKIHRFPRIHRFLVFFLFYFCIFFYAGLLRLVLINEIETFFGITAVFSSFICHFSSSSDSANANEPSWELPLPELESESSSVSLHTFRNVLAVEQEQGIYARIQILENGGYYNLPPQTRPGEYLEMVRNNFDQAISVNHLRSALDMEYWELQILEKKALVQERLFSLMIAENNLSRILELSPHSNIRKEAYDFLEMEVAPLNDLSNESVTRELGNLLDSLVNEIEGQGRASKTYRGFYSHFTDQEFRRSHGLPLP